MPHRLAGYYKPQCASTYSRASIGLDLMPGQPPVCRCEGPCWGDGRFYAMLPPPHAPMLAGLQYQERAVGYQD